jgi:hypothetical protein
MACSSALAEPKSSSASMRRAQVRGATGGSFHRWRSRRRPSGCSPTSMMRGCSRTYKKWLRVSSTPVKMPQYMRGAVSSVMPNVAAAMAASTRDVRQMRTNAPGLTSPSTASTTTAASTACGTWCSSGSSHSSVTSTSPTAITLAQPVCAPAYRLSAERENDELVGNAPLTAAASLAMPWPIRSWFWSQPFCRAALSCLGAGCGFNEADERNDGHRHHQLAQGVPTGPAGHVNARHAAGQGPHHRPAAGVEAQRITQGPRTHHHHQHTWKGRAQAACKPQHGQAAQPEGQCAQVQRRQCACLQPAAHRACQPQHSGQLRADDEQSSRLRECRQHG